MKQLFQYLSGKVQFAPSWFYKLPHFFIPIYQGNDLFRWLGKEYKASGQCGDTLFMALKRKSK
jgi:hypothetical protein